MTSATKKVSPFDFLIWPRKKGHYGFDPICPKWGDMSGSSLRHITTALAIKVFSIMPSEICDERTASRLGRFNSARTASMAPDSLVECAKLYDYYTYAPDAPEDIAAIRSAPTVMDLVNDENLDINSLIDIAALEELWFNAPDPYDLSEADRCPLDAPFVMRSISRFEISDYVKLDSPGLSELILVLRLLA
ncbi:hypothetical protein B0H14DRAFT_2569660 [Mycena olivaceomarginata]|nr:hypothetical protein B0H14DRAFT_2569660 [Mycena olivaceomarginata]